jgi:hypothetical protein
MLIFKDLTSVFLKEEDLHKEKELNVLTFQLLKDLILPLSSIIKFAT